MPPLDGAAHAHAEAFAFGRRHVNPVLIFGITLFGLGAIYLALVVALRAQPILFPGQQPGLGPLTSIVPVDVEPDVANAEQRINILFMGLDLRRDESDDTPARTDTVFVLTIDPYSKTAGILSIPRDLAMDIPDGSGGYVTDRVNTAYERGEMRKTGSGPDVAIKTVEKMFKDEIHQDVPIDYYVVLNFNNFIAIVDELGGVDVNVPEYVYDPAYNDCNSCYYHAVEFLPGPQHMDGKTALAYSRLRKSDNDFKRIERQQLVMKAVAKKAAGLDWLTRGKALSLYSEYKDSVKTNVSDSKVPGLALLGSQIGVDNIRTESLGEAVYPCPYSICGGAAMLLPLPDKIAEVYARIFGDSRIQSEAATVKVLNGTHTPDLAGDFAAYLRSQGIPKEKALTDEYVGGALFNNTFILSINRKPVTLGKIAEWLKLPESATKTLADLTPEEQTQLLDAKADIVVVLGADAHVPEVASSGSNQGPSSDTSDTSSTDDSTEPVAPIHTPGQTLEPEPAATEAPTAEPATPTPEATATPVFEPIASPLATPEARRRGR